MKSVLGYEKYYRISENGKIWSIRSNKFLKPYLEPAGYLRVILCVNRKVKLKRIHQLVCEAFHGSKLNNMEVSHLNNNKTDNRAKNLCWATRKENIANSPISDFTRHKLCNSRKGSKNPNYGKHRKHSEQIKKQISDSLKESWAIKKNNMEII